jgi:hypothetical protein
MSEEVELAAEATGAVVKALADASGAVEPVREFSEYIASAVHYRYFPKLVDRAIRAAEKIEASGLPRRAFSEVRDPLLKAILEAGAMEDDPTLQGCWENLLANALVDGPAQVKAAFPQMLSELDPVEALTLEKLATGTMLATGHSGMIVCRGDFSGITADGWENLKRLGLIQMDAGSGPPQLARVGNHVGEVQNMAFTTLGRKFVQACREPGTPAKDGIANG